MNWQKKTLLGFNAAGTAGNAYFLFKEPQHPLYNRNRALGGVISGVLTTWLIWKA